MACPLCGGHAEPRLGTQSLRLSWPTCVGGTCIVDQLCCPGLMPARGRYAWLVAVTARPRTVAASTPTVLHLRESAAHMGLLRKRRGMLMLTSRARGLRDDPVALWWHLAERTPPKSPRTQTRPPHACSARSAGSPVTAPNLPS